MATGLPYMSQNKISPFSRCFGLFTLRCAIYSAVAYIEKKQLQRNINISGTRGKKVEKMDNGIAYELEDGYTVLDDIKGTPRYWKKAKYEMLAKLENL